MSVHLSIHLGSCSFSRQTFSMGGDHWGSIFLDEQRRAGISGSAAEWRALADLIIELADDIEWRSAAAGLSPLEVVRRDAVRQEQHLRLLADRLERVGGDLDD